MPKQTKASEEAFVVTDVALQISGTQREPGYQPKYPQYQPRRCYQRHGSAKQHDQQEEYKQQYCQE